MTVRLPLLAAMSGTPSAHRLAPAASQYVVQRKKGARTDDQPGREDEEPGVPQQLSTVAGLVRGNITAAPEAAAVDRETARPGLRDARDEDQEQQRGQHRHQP